MTAYSYQLYSSRMFSPLSATLQMLADLGYAQVEGYGALLEDGDALDTLETGLKDTGLAMPTCHVSLDMCRDDPAAVLEIARRFGLRAIIVPFIQPADRPGDAAGWAAYGAGLAEAGKRYVQSGLGFAYHNHDFEYLPCPDGAVPLDLILGTDPHLQLEYDVAWAVRAGVDPMRTIDRYGDRILAAHLKDIAPEGSCADEDGWADLGHGTMSWGTILPALRDAGCSYFVMEHDKPGDHRRFASRALATARTL